MPKVSFSVDTDVAPEQVFAAITDFSDDRPRLWPNIGRDVYKLHGEGENWAECTEGGDDFGGVWAKERYEWSPGHVKATVMESNIFESGVWEMRITPREGGGSHVEVLNHRHTKGKGRLIAPIIKLAGKPLFKQGLEKTFKVLREDAAATKDATPAA